MNSVQLMGRLGADPETRYSSGGNAVTTLNIATEGYRNKEKVTDWHRVVCFGKTAENAAQYLSKGSGVCIEGRLQTRTWDKDGEKRYITEVVANRVHFLPTSKGGGGEQSKPAPKKKESPPPSEDDPSDDIPF